MKFLYSIVILTALAFATNAQTINWGSPIPVAGPQFGYTRPHVAVCNNIPVAVWGNEATNKIYASRYVSGSFTTPVDVSPNFPAYVLDWMAPEIAATGETLYVTFADTGMMHIYLVRSIDGGLTFGDTVRVDYGPGYMPVEPSVDIAAGGNPIVSYIVSEMNYTDARTMVARSTDGGVTFLPAVDATTTVAGEACDCCKGGMAVNGNDAVLLFRNNENNIRDIFASISTDGGATFTSSAQMDFNDWMIMSCPTTPPDGYIFGDTLVTVFMSAGSGTNKVYVSALDLNTLQQAVQQELLSGTDNQNYPRLAGTENKLGTVWQQNVSGTAEIIFSSSNGPFNFDNEMNLSETLAGAQSQPDISYGNNSYQVVFQNDSSQQVYFITGELTTSIQNVAANSQLFDLVKLSSNDYAIHFNSNAENVMLRINAVNGQNVLTTEIGNAKPNQEVLLNTSSLSSGMYFISLTSHQGVNTEKLLISK